MEALVALLWVLVSLSLRDAEAIPLKHTVNEVEQPTAVGDTTTMGSGRSSSSSGGVGGISGGISKQGISMQAGSFNEEGGGFWQKLHQLWDAVDTAGMAMEVALSEMMDTLLDRLGLG